jgi:L-alanine-DL-glutamate epimerase-like enolase superfamily enzyme
MMVISDLELYLVEIGCVGREPPVRSVLVRLATDTGAEGWGEAQMPWQAGELAGRRNALLPILAGRSVYDIEDLLGLSVLASAPLRSALEMASWDLVGRAAGQPLCHLFGGGYRRRIPVTIRLTGATVQQLSRLARELAEQGFHSQVLPLSGSLEKDLETVTAVRQILPQRTELRLDGAAAYDLETAWELCLQLEDRAIRFLLDPTKTLDLVQMATLRRQTSVCLAVQRPIRSPGDVLAVVRSGAAPFAVVDLDRVGGMLPARKCAAIAQAAGLHAALAIGPSLGVSAAAMLQVASATPAYSGCNETSYHHLQDDLLTEPLDIADGIFTVPQGPGLGVEVDRAKVERYQVE